MSLNDILGKVKPSVVTLNETFLKNKRKLNIKGYSFFNLNRDCEDGGGVATGVLNSDKISVLKVFEGKNDLEIIVTRHGQFSFPINVINVYGQVESRSNLDEIRERWGIIYDQIMKIESRGELLVLIGDLNTHLGELIPGNNSRKLSEGGKLLKDFLESDKYTLVNATEKVVGGPFTRVDPGNGQKSILDICIVSNELYKYIEVLSIDSKREITPYRPLNRNKVT